MVGDRVLADDEVVADLPVAETAGDEAQHDDFPRREPVGQVGEPRSGRPEPLDLRGQRRQPERCGGLRHEPEELGGADTRIGARIRAEELRVVAAGVREPQRRAHAAVEVERRLEVLRRERPVADRRRELAEEPVGGAEAGDEVSDEQGRSAVRLELRIETGGALAVSERELASVQVCERGGTERVRASRGRSCSQNAVSSACASSVMSSSVRSAISPGRQVFLVSPLALSRRTTGASSGRRPCSRRMLKSCSPKAPEASGPCIRLAHSPARSAISSASASRPSQSASDDPNVWRHGGGTAAGSARPRCAARRASLRAAARSPMETSVTTRQAIASARIVTSWRASAIRFASASARGPRRRRRRRAPSSVGRGCSRRRARRRSAGPSERLRPRRGGLLVPAEQPEGACEAAQQPDAELRLVGERAQRFAQQLLRSPIGDSRPPARLFRPIAARAGARVVEPAGELGRRREAVDRLERPARPVQRGASSSSTAARWRSSSMPRASAVRNRSAASS